MTTEKLTVNKPQSEGTNKKANTTDPASSKSPPGIADKNKAPESEVKAIEPPNFASAHECITVTAGSGKEKKLFMIHKEFASYHSPVFRAAFNSKSNFTESQTNTYTMKDIDAGTMQLLVQWLYTQKVGLKPLVVESEGAMERFAPMNTSAFKLWYLGDRLIIPKLQNDVVDYIWTLNDTGKWIPAPCFHDIYGNTLGGSPLRRLFVMFCAQGLPASTYAKNINSFPQEMLLDLVQQLKEHGNGNISRTPAGSKETFHVKVGVGS